MQRIPVSLVKENLPAIVLRPHREVNPLVRQAEASQGGCCLEFTFWLYAQAWADFEHDTADIMEYIYAASAEYGLTIYQQFPEQ